MTKSTKCPECGSSKGMCICEVDLKASRLESINLNPPSEMDTRSLQVSDISRNVKIIDLSKWDPDFTDYDLYDGIIPRCYNGTSPDLLFPKHKEGAKLANKPWWAYSFYNFKFPAAPQAEAVANILANDTGYISPYWDVEKWRYWDGTEWVWVLYPPRDVLLSGMFTLYDRYKKLTGLETGFYMNPDTINYLSPIPQWLLKCNLWIAHWGVLHPDHLPWEHETFHQYEGDPDHSRYYDTDEKYWEYMSSTQIIPPSNDLPNYVIINGAYGYLWIRSAPNIKDSRNIIGKLYNGHKWKPTALVINENGEEFWKINDYAYIAKWLTKWENL